MPWYKITFTTPVPDEEWWFEEKALSTIERKRLWDDRAERYSMNDSVRGKVEVFEHPPVEDCRRMIEASKRSIEWDRQRIQRLERWATSAAEAAERLSGPPKELEIEEQSA